MLLAPAQTSTQGIYGPYENEQRGGGLALGGGVVEKKKK